MPYRRALLVCTCAVMLFGLVKDNNAESGIVNRISHDGRSKRSIDAGAQTGIGNLGAQLAAGMRNLGALTGLGSPGAQTGMGSPGAQTGTGGTGAQTGKDGSEAKPPSRWDQAGQALGLLNSGIDTFVKINDIIMSRQEAKLKAEKWRHEKNMQLAELCDKICVTEWSYWSMCSARCGGGQMSRTRQHETPGRCKELGSFSCRHSTSQTQVCNSGCANNGWAVGSGGKCQCPKGFGGNCCNENIICPYPGKPQNGRLQGKFPASYGTVAVYLCNSGYSLVGQDQLYCRDSGKWDGHMPKCVKVTCNRPPEPINGRIINTQTKFYFGDELLYKCKDGYGIQGSPNRKCIHYDGPDGKWTGFPPYCEANSCGDPGEPLFGIREGTNFRLDGKVTYRCLRGFRLKGSAERTCLPHGKWSGHSADCEVIKCDPPLLRTKHIEIVGTREEYRYGARLWFDCKPGYYREGPRVLMCVQDQDLGFVGPGGKWNDTVPDCKPAMCIKPEVPEHGSKDGGLYYYPHSVTYSCFAGYVMKGESTVKCEQSGTWSGPPPVCEACPKGYYKVSSNNTLGCLECPPFTHTITDGSTSSKQCLCNHGYTGPAGGPCQEIRCPVLEAPTNGSISECDNKFQSQCDVTCDEGFIVEKGHGRRNCQETGQWTGIVPNCKICPKDTFKSDERSCLPCAKNSHTNEPGSMRSACVCDAGYQGPSGGPCTDIDECSRNGTNGRGSCEDQCENTIGGYRCLCSIPGYIIEDSNGHTCIVNKTCRNLTETDAPANGGLVCHWYREENSQQCSVKCNLGYEFPARRNNYETCGQTTGYRWTHEERAEIIEPCIEEFFPDFRLEGSSAYFVRACKNLTAEEQQAVKEEFVKTLNKQGVCVKRRTKVCDVNNVGIICGKTTRRRKRGVSEDVDEVDFNFQIKAFQVKERLLDCDDICKFLRIPQQRCKPLCLPTYKRFLRAAVLYSRGKLGQIFKQKETVRFEAAKRHFEPKEAAVQTTEVIVECKEGMKPDGPDRSTCVPCLPGSFYYPGHEMCIPCGPGYHQPKSAQKQCLPCPVGTYSDKSGTANCKVCPEGTYGWKCNSTCDCVHGSCDPVLGQCTCDSGWEGTRCDKDIQSCDTGSCFKGVPCYDVRAPGIGYRCGPCPTNMRGDGSVCT